MTIEDTIFGSHFSQIGSVPDFTTTQDGYDTIYEIPVLLVRSKKLSFSCLGHDLLVTIFGDIGNGMYSEVPIPEFLVTADNPVITVTVHGVFANIRIMAKPASPGANGTLSTWIYFET